MIASHSAMMLKRQWVRRVRINTSTNVINEGAVPPLTTVSNFTAHLCTDTPRLLLKHFEWFNVFSFKKCYCFNKITLVVHIKVTLQRLKCVNFYILSYPLNFNSFQFHLKLTGFTFSYHSSSDWQLSLSWHVDDVQCVNSFQSFIFSLS